METTMVTRSTVEPLAFTEEQRKMIRDTFANGASDAEFAVLMEVARARRINPLLRQVHFVSRWDSQKSRMVWAVQVSIDGLRAIAERTGLYAGQDDPEFAESPDGSIKSCKVRVYRRDWPRPAVGTAYWEEYVQTRRDKATGKTVVTEMWRRMPHVMLAKCAESLALRKAFPEDMGGLYTGEEMGQASNDVEEPDVRVVSLPAAPALPASEAPAQDKPEGSRAFAAFVLRVSSLPTVTELLAAYHGLVADLREEGHDPAEYLADGADPAALGAVSMVQERIHSLGHRLAKVDITTLLAAEDRRIAVLLDSQAEVCAGKVGVDLKEAIVGWWLAHRAEAKSDPAAARVLYYALVRRWDGSDDADPSGSRTKKARAQLDAAVKTAESSAASPEPTSASPAARKVREVLPGAEAEVRAHVGRYGHPRAIENAARKYAPMPALHRALADRLMAVTPADDDGTRLTERGALLQVEAWSQQEPVAAVRKAVGR